jgi:hypothetical protein
MQFFPAIRRLNDAVDRLIQTIDDSARHAGRPHDPKPIHDLEIGNSAFRNGRHSREQRVRSLAATPIAFTLFELSIDEIDPRAANIVETWPPISSASDMLAPS